MSDIKQSDLIFYEEPAKNQAIVEEEKAAAQTVEAAQKAERVPADYVAVKLDSLGKLSAPGTLHFRNYSMEEAVELATTDEESFIETMIGCLNQMVWEDFDCGQLHESELEEVLLTIYAAFWGKELEGFQYYVDDSLEGERLTDRENISVAAIPIRNIETKPIIDEFKEPISLTIKGKQVRFSLPRIQGAVVAKRYADALFAAEERELSDVKVKYEFNQRVGENGNQYDIDPALIAQYEDLLKRKQRAFLKAHQAQLLVGIDDERFESFEQQIAAMPRVGYDFWQKYNSVVSKKLNFGVDSEVEFTCSKTGKPITRRFQFRFVDFIPPVDDADDSEVDIRFGD